MHSVICLVERDMDIEVFALICWIPYYVNFYSFMSRAEKCLNELECKKFLNDYR